MSHQEKLCAYMATKVGLLPGKPYHLLFTEKDQEDLLSWPDDSAKNVVSKLTEALKNLLNGIPSYDTGLCPWCQLYVPCRLCSFGLRHGNCSTDDKSGYAMAMEIINDYEYSLVDCLEPHAAQLLACLSDEGKFRFSETIAN